MGKKPTIAAIQFTKDELRMIDKGIDQFFAEWYNGYRSAGRAYTAARIREKVRSALGIPLRASPEKAPLKISDGAAAKGEL